MSVGIISLSGFNTRALLAVCRYVDRSGKIVHLWAQNKDDPIFHTKYSPWVFSVREQRDLNMASFLAFISDVKARYGYEKILLLPTSEYLNRFTLRNRDLIEGNGCALGLTPRDTYEAFSDKYSFGIVCKKNGLLVPRELSVDELNYPFVAKHRTYGSLACVQLKPYLIFSPRDWDDFSNRESADEFYFQEFLNGASYYLLFYIQKKGEASLFSQENLIQQSGGRSIICARSAHVHEEEICRQCLSMIRDTGFHGLLMIELRLHEGRYYIIEANPRFWGPIQLSVDAGSDIVRQFLLDNGIELDDDGDARSPVDEDPVYFWAGGLVSDQRDGRFPTFHAYDKRRFCDDYHHLIRSDVIMRPDTIDLYMKEMEGVVSL